MRIEVDKSEVKYVQNQILNAIANSILDNVLKESDRQDLFTFGNYDRGWEKRVDGTTEVKIKVHQPVANNLGFLMEIQPYGYSMTQSFIAEVGNTAVHAALIEWGHKPYRPPIAEIVKWVEKVKGEQGRDAIVAASKIANNFATHGFKPHYILTRAVINTVRKFQGE